MKYGLGEWIQDQDGKTYCYKPFFSGTWPFIDKCRNYACIILVENPLKEDKKETYLQVKNIIDEQIGCK